MLIVLATSPRVAPGLLSWDAWQALRSASAVLAPAGHPLLPALEETYEALEALESGDDRAFCEELGDVLLQVLFHARVAAERADGYTIDDVADGIVARLVRRHPHVFAGVTVSGAEEVYRNCDEIKRAEKRERAEWAGSLPLPAARRPRLTVCRSASLPWPWPRSCNAGRRARAYRTRWRASTTTPARPVRPAPAQDISRELFLLVVKS